MSSTDYIRDLDIGQLEYLIEISQAKLKDIRSQPKQRCFVVSDSYLNYGHFKMDEPEMALAAFNKEFEKRCRKDGFDGLTLEVCKYYPDEMQELFE
jgi:hypothetical protein